MQPANEVRGAIPAIAPERRVALAADAAATSHAELMARVPELGILELESTHAALPDELCAVCWNGERGRFVLEATPMPPAELYLLSEMDAGMARTDNVHTVRELARRLGMNYLYAIEFLELTKGEPEERDAPGENALGFHGNAILTRGRILEPRLLRLDGGEQWLDDAQQRIGSRIALIATIETAHGPLRAVSTHLESEAAPDLRARQMRQLLEYLDGEDASDQPTVIGGDLNTWSFDKTSAAEQAALASDPNTPVRLLRPMAWEPLFEELRTRGYEVDDANDLSRGTYPVPGFPVEARLDWIVTKGLSVREPAVIEAPRSERLGRPVSDHHAIRACIDLPPPQSS